MNYAEKIAALEAATAVMDSSKQLCVSDARKLIAEGKLAAADQRLEKAAQYAWGHGRPDGWHDAARIREDREQWLADQGCTYGVGVDRTGQRRHGWWLDGVYLGDTARDAVSAVRG